MKIQVYLDGVTGERLVALADLESRSVSSMARLLLERALAPGEPLKPRTVPVRTEATGRVVVKEPVVVESPRVPPETPPRAETVERIQQQVPGVQRASVAFPSVPQDLARQVTPRPRSG